MADRDVARSSTFVWGSLAVFLCIAPMLEAAADLRIDLIVEAGRPLRVALDSRVTPSHVGQSLSGTIAEDVYAYDRIVVPIGTRVSGHIERLDGGPRAARIRRALNGDFTPLRIVTLEFDALIFDDGRRVPISTKVTMATENVSRQIAGGSRKSRTARRMENLKESLISQLPYHRQYLREGTVYTAELLAPLHFGSAVPIERAAVGSNAQPDAFMHARLLTALDSAKTPRGTAIRAVLTRPLLSEDQRLILPEGTELQGEVTFARRADSFRRNGRLRFLFERVRPPNADEPAKLLASLHATELSDDDHLVIDDEGGARVTNPKTRFVAPALAALASVAATSRDPIDAGEIPSAPLGTNGANIGGRTAGGLVGLGVLGIFVGQISRPVAVTLGLVGLAQSLYVNVFGKGSEVVMPADTPLQLELAPAKP